MSKNCACFDVSLGCSGYVYGLSVASGFMASNSFDNVVFVTADPYSKIVSKHDKNTSMLFGDAATATLIQNDIDKKGLSLKKAMFGTDGSKRASLHVTERQTLEMNGREIFNFSATTVPEQIINLVKSLNYSLDDIDGFIFHHGSKFVVDTIAKKLDISKNRF